MLSSIGRKSFADYAFCLLVGSIYIFAINRTIVTSTLIWIDPLSLFFIGVVAIVLVMAMLFNKYTRIGTVAVLAFVLFFFFITLNDFAEQYPNMYDLWLMVRGYAFIPELGNRIIWILSFLLAVVVVVFTLYQFNFMLLAIGAVAVFLFSWVPGFTRDETAFLFFLLSFCLLLIRRMNRSTVTVIIAAPFCALLVFTAHFSMPRESEVFVERGLSELRAFNLVEDRMFEFFNPMYFSFQTTGFTGAGGRLGGAVTQNNRQVMSYHGPGRIYLAGAISETYTGYTWVSTLQPGDVYTHGLAPGSFEMLETAVAITRQWINSNEEYFRMRRLLADNLLVLGDYAPVLSELPLDFSTAVINIGSQRTGTVFTPPALANLSFHYGGGDYLDVLMVDPSGSIRAPMFMSRNTTYQLHFLNADTDNPLVQDIIFGTGAGFYQQQPALNAIGVDELFNMIHHGFDVVDNPILEWLDGFAYHMLAEYAAQVRKSFLEVPEIVPQRVYDLTMEIVAGLETDYERVMAIRGFLLQFPYTLETVPVPRGVCFVDHFLFYGRQGYCTYFASAMAVMSRIAGVPSRYVEGFVVPPAFDDLIFTNITNRMAHAWVEVYLEGFGWLVVEATPTYAGVVPMPMPPTFFLPPEFTFDDVFFDEEWYLMMHAQLHYDPFDEWEMDLQGGENATIPQRIVSGDNLGSNILWLVAAALLCILAYAIFCRQKMRRSIKNTKKLTPQEQVKVYFAGITDIITYYTKPFNPSETPKGYGGRMGRRFAFRSDSVFYKDLITLYYKAKYSADEITAKDAALMEEAYFDMLMLLRMRRQKFVFVYLRYVSGVGKLRRVAP
ncbi:MAG: transglutaminase-like domain-containing protein [Defluviitaleaceae bacterium]|nr:transglutaminase-like domain-containing protein [Defluviitaleaceae bacterium]